ncbi:MAG: transposase [Deltaproteobacteria bacterium]|nr:transposase [Deltaproteobacteria bacterium]
MAKRSASRRPRRQFSDEFMVGAVRLVLDEGKTIGAVARELDLTPSSLANWVRHARADRTKGKTGLTTEERAELATLRKENRELRMERDILKNHRARRVPCYLLDQKLPVGLSSRHPGRNGRLLFGDAANP